MHFIEPNEEKAQAYIRGVIMALLGINIFPNAKVSEAQLDCAKELALHYVESEIDKAIFDTSQRAKQKQQWREWADKAYEGFKKTLKANNRLY